MGTEGEQALVDAFMHEFGFAQHLTCFIHVRRNVKEKLRVYNIPTQHSMEVLDDIFGKNWEQCTWKDWWTVVMPLILTTS